MAIRHRSLPSPRSELPWLSHAGGSILPHRSLKSKRTTEVGSGHQQTGERLEETLSKVSRFVNMRAMPKRSAGRRFGCVCLTEEKKIKKVAATFSGQLFISASARAKILNPLGCASGPGLWNVGWDDGWPPFKHPRRQERGLSIRTRGSTFPAKWLGWVSSICLRSLFLFCPVGFKGTYHYCTDFHFFQGAKKQMEGFHAGFLRMPQSWGRGGEGGEGGEGGGEGREGGGEGGEGGEGGGRGGGGEGEGRGIGGRGGGEGEGRERGGRGGGSPNQQGLFGIPPPSPPPQGPHDSKRDTSGSAHFANRPFKTLWSSFFGSHGW